MTDPETRKKRSITRKRNIIAKKMREDMPKKVHLSKKDREKQRIWRLKDDPSGDYEAVDDLMFKETKMAKKSKKYVEGRPSHEKPEGKKLEKAEKKMGEKKAEAAFMKKGKKKHDLKFSPLVPCSAKKLYKLDTEWDIGYNHTVFATRQLALKALEEAHSTLMEEEGTVQELMDDGLYNIVEVEYIDG